MSTDLINLQGEVAVVTGAGSGIGEGVATTFAGAGAAVVCALRRLDEIERVAASIRDRGGRAIAVATDVTGRGAVDGLANVAIAEFGRLDIWINNAGGSPIRAQLVELPTEIMMTAHRLEDADLPALERRLRLPMGRLEQFPRALQMLFTSGHEGKLLLSVR